MEERPIGKRFRRVRWQQRRLRILSDFNAMLAQANQIIATVEDERSLLQGICKVAVQHGHAVLAWVGMPDDTGRFHVLAAAGRTDYLDGIVISSRPGTPEGDGPSGRAWREMQPYHVPVFAKSDLTAPWAERARRYGIAGSAAMPIVRDGRLWGLLSTYVAQSDALDEHPKALLEELGQDISRGLDRLDAMRRERQLAALQKTLLQNTVAGICLSRDRRFVEVNTRYAEILGYDSPQELTGEPARVIYPDDAEYGRVGRLLDELVRQGHASARAVRLLRKDGREILCDVDAGLIRDAGAETVVWTLLDVTERRRLEEQLQHQATHDPLTDLPNRRSLDFELPHAIARAKRLGAHLIIGMLDMDDFKSVNDAFGHEVGDHLLQTFGSRLRNELREVDFLARVGGDEFVVLFEDILGPVDRRSLAAMLARMHHAVERPFDLGDGKAAEVGMSMGVAVYPLDGEDGDILLREADAALYRAKSHKLDREAWWQWGTFAEEAEPSVPMDPYGDAVAQVLARGQHLIGEIADRVFSASPADLPAAAQAAMHTLGDEELLVLRRHQAEHLRFVADPATSREQILEKAREIGEVQALVGVSGPETAQVLFHFHQMITAQLNALPLPVRHRYQLVLAMHARLQDDLGAQLSGQDETLDRYAALESAALPADGARWADVTREEVRALGGLPGIVVAGLYRLGADGVFAVEQAGGPRGAETETTSRQPEFRIVLDPSAAQGQGLIARAWLSQEVLTSADHLGEPAAKPWREVSASFGIRSMLAVPVEDGHGHTVAVLGLYGTFRSQFSSQRMQRFAQTLRQRWREIWQRCSTPAATNVLPQDVAQNYRDRLFRGGLSMYVQPIVDLRSGQPMRFEALSRLLMPDGALIAPGEFLPLLGDGELARLFRMGLDLALGHLSDWDRQGPPFEISLNLAPSTLDDPDCASWVLDALTRHGIAPSRLRLELLESQVLDRRSQTAAVTRLAELGVQIVIDDLGSGHSTLQRVSALPFRSIKIDQVLLARLRTSPLETMSLMKALIQMAEDIERDVVVEGLEDAGMIEAAAALGARYGQGFGLAEPMRASRVADWYSGFRLPIEPGRYHTYLGALAYHWRFMQAGAYRTRPPLEDCPITAFLAEQGAGARAAAAWHAEIHANHDAPHASRQLRDWLMERLPIEVEV